MGMDVLMDPKSSTDDTAMGGAKIICDALNEDNLNIIRVDTQWGDWVNDDRNDL